MQTLKLGAFDQGHSLEKIHQHLALLHNRLDAGLSRKKQYRNEGHWFDPQSSGSEEVKELETFLQAAGFLPFHQPNGIFDYFTLAGVRLFQEYVRTVEKDTSIGKPDGVVGPNTWKHIERWKADPTKVADWGLLQLAAPTEAQQAQLEKQRSDYDFWLNLMKKAQQHYLDNPHPILQLSDGFAGESDTLKVKDWTFDPKDIHLIGIRRSQEAGSHIRINDDIFVLLVNGMVFKFWGSTDPSQAMAFFEKDAGDGKKIKIFTDEPFLVEGQHRYCLGWHKFADSQKVYKALEPAGKGVLVFRDKNKDDALTEADIEAGIEGPNDTINIHWSGAGSANWSAGCQVISGQSYINHKDEVVSCAEFAASGYNELGLKTKGAYNVLSDLVLAYYPQLKLEDKGHTMLYTLGRDDVMTLLEPELENFAAQSLQRMLKPEKAVV